MRTFFTIVVLSLTLLLAGPTNAQSWKTAKYDTAWLPITRTQLAVELRRNINDATPMYQLWRRARYQKLAQEGFDILRKLKSEHPNNANVLAVYCMAIEQQTSDDGKPRFQADPEEMRLEARRANIAEIKTLNPKLWMGYAAQGRFEYNTTAFDVNDQVSIYRKALSLAPNLSFTNSDYSDALTGQLLARKQPFTPAIYYLNIALRASNKTR